MASKTEQIEYEEITVKIPKAIIEFLKDHEDMLEEKAEEYLERCIVGVVSSDIESQDCFVLSPVKLVKKYKLEPIFKKFDVVIS
jgi:hypothetical protein